MGPPAEAAEVHDERAEEDPLRPEVAVVFREGPDQNADHVDEGVLERKRAPAEVARPEARRRLAPRELPERALEISTGARGVHLGEPALELVERQPSAVVVLA